MKRCSWCKKKKSLSEFWKDKGNKSGYKSYCKICDTERRTQWRRKNPSKSAGFSRKTKYKIRYGITLEEYDKIFEKQNGVCAICGRPEKTKTNGVIIRLSVDHNHQTKKTRGLLCHTCNSAIGYLMDSFVLCKKAAKYLRERGI